MKDYALIARYKAMEGFFKKKVIGEFLVVAAKDGKHNAFVMFQFLRPLGIDEYIVTMITSIQTQDDEYIESGFDNLRYNNYIDVLEDKLPMKMTASSGKLVITFTKPSK